jgi:glycerol-3-phosphate cytidylyltransferase-like family protein
MLFSDDEVASWEIKGGAHILSLEAFLLYQPCLSGRIVLTSGGYDPIHSGHQSVFVDAKNLPWGHTATPYDQNLVVVIVNGDNFLRNKKKVGLMPIQARCEVVSLCRGVDYVIPWDATNKDDNTVCEVIERMRPAIFAKGGDRVDIKTIPEWETCKAVGTEIVTGLGTNKCWSSSDFLEKYYSSRTRL